MARLVSIPPVCTCYPKYVPRPRPRLNASGNRFSFMHIHSCIYAFERARRLIDNVLEHLATVARLKLAILYIYIHKYIKYIVGNSTLQLDRALPHKSVGSRLSLCHLVFSLISTAMPIQLIELSELRVAIGLFVMA